MEFWYIQMPGATTGDPNHDKGHLEELEMRDKKKPIGVGQMLESS